MEPVAQMVRRAAFRHKLLRAPLVRAYHRDLVPEDAFLASYPRSGVTWLRFVLCEALTGRPAEFGSVRRDSPYIGRHRNGSRILGGGGRLIRTHETYTDGDRRVVYLVRDPRSVVVSEYAWQHRRRLGPGSMDGFVADFVAGRSNPWGSWGQHVRSWLDSLAARNNNVLVVKFEDLRHDTEGVVSRILSFLGESRDASVVRDAVAGNTLEEMRAKEARRRQEVAAGAQRESLLARFRSVRRDIPFVNAGSVEGWKQRLSPGQAELIARTWAGTLEHLGYVDERVER